MSAPTPDRAALAERLRFLARGLRRIADTPCNSDDCDIPHLDCTVSADAMDAAAAALAAPAVPPSVAEARSVVMRGAAQFGYASDADVDALIAATVAEAVRVVEALPRSEGVTTFGHTGFVMERTEGGSWIYDEHALDALRALGITTTTETPNA